MTVRLVMKRQSLPLDHLFWVPFQPLCKKKIRKIAFSCVFFTHKDKLGNGIFQKSELFRAAKGIVSQKLL